MKKLFAVTLCILLFSSQAAYAASAFTGTGWVLVAYGINGETYEADAQESIQFTDDRNMVWTDNDGAHNGTYRQSGDNLTMSIFGGELNAYISRQSNDTYLVVEDLLERDWIFKLQSGELQDTGSDGVGGFIKDNQSWLIGAGIGVAVVFLVLKNRKPTPAPVPSATPGYPPPASPGYPPASPGQIPMTMPVTQPIQTPSQPAGAAAPSSIICTKGQYAGSTFPINGSLSIGRDPRRCQLVFPNDAKGISSFHCQVRQQGYDVTVTDMGSTYGTVVMGRKLNAHETVTLKSGDSFHLADANNEFKVL